MTFTWRAHYNDGTFLDQGSQVGDKKDYGAIDRIKLIAFEILDEKKRVYMVHLQPGQRLIYRMRVSRDFYNADIQFTIWLVGWQQTINGKNIQSIAHIFPDGHVESAGIWLGANQTENSGEFVVIDGGVPELREDEK